MHSEEFPYCQCCTGVPPGNHVTCYYCIHCYLYNSYLSNKSIDTFTLLHAHTHTLVHTHPPTHTHTCAHPPTHTHTRAQAIGDPGQGWGNALLYIFMSDNIRERMLCSPFRKCARKVARGLLDYTQLSNTEEEEALRNGPRNVPEQEVPSVPGRGRPVQRYSSHTCSTISITAAEISHAGPLDEEAKPGPSPVPWGQKLPSETTTTTTTMALAIQT